MFFKRHNKKRVPLDLDSMPQDPAYVPLFVTRLLLRDRRGDRKFRLARLVIILIAPVLWAIYVHVLLGSRTPGASWFASGPEIALVRLTGNVGEGSATADAIVPVLRRAFATDRVKAIALMIDSPGGSPIEAERINAELAILKKQHPKPVSAIVNSLGASAAYLIAMHADKVVAGRYSLVGSIGAVIDSWDFSGALSKVDVKQRVYASGDLKAMLNPFVASNAQADAKAQTLVNVLAAQFLSDLHAQRGKKLLEMKYDSGEVWDGQTAMKIGLVDEIGTLETVEQELGKLTPGIQATPYGPGSQRSGIGLSSALSAILSLVSSASQHLRQ